MNAKEAAEKSKERAAAIKKEEAAENKKESARIKLETENKHKKFSTEFESKIRSSIKYAVERGDTTAYQQIVESTYRQGSSREPWEAYEFRDEVLAVENKLKEDGYTTEIKDVCHTYYSWSENEGQSDDPSYIYYTELHVSW